MKSQLMERSVVNVKGLVLIPVNLRRKVGIKKGTPVLMEEKNGDIIMHPITPEFYDRYYGWLKGGNLLKVLEQSRREEKEHEDRKIAGR
jgi:bifunctional DNA-binding transcriptional regulator/antitoxin component of YhaV-PrlF toxin-antitoxin module